MKLFESMSEEFKNQLIEDLKTIISELDNKGELRYNDISERSKYLMGATKLCIDDLSCDYVFKISLTHDIEDRELKVNHAEKEEQVYTWAEQAGVAAALLPIKFFMVIKGYEVYIQPRCEVVDTDDVVIYNKGDKELKNDLSPQVEETFLKTYGIEYMRKLDEFFEINGIDDITDYNVGIYNDKPVIFDYAGDQRSI